MKAPVLLFLLLCVGVSACASRQANYKSELPVQVSDDPREQIEQLERDSEILRLGAGLPAGPSEDLVAMATVQAPVAPQVCRGRSSQAQRCVDSCKLSDSICGNAVRICDLASKVLDREWGEQKCKRANASCSQAQQRCCSCADDLGVEGAAK